MLAKASLFFLLVKVFIPSFLQIYLQSSGMENVSLIISGVFSRYWNLLNVTVAFTRRATGISIFTGKPFWNITSFKLLFFMKSFIFYIFEFPPIESVFRTVRKFWTFKGNSFESHRELSICFFTSLDNLLLLLFSVL